jgi:AhpD family alkylhydroperoxidase
MSATPDPDDAGRIPDADDAGRRGAATVAAAALGVHLLVHAAHGVPASGFRPLTRLSYWVSRRWFGEVPEPLTVTAHHGPVFLGVNAFEAALDRADRVDEGLKELAVVKIATLVGCAFCVDIGSALAADHGVEARKLRDIGDFESSDAFSDRERLVLRYAVATTTTPADVPEDLFEAMTAEFDDAELVELTAAVAFENYRARFNHALGIEAQGFAEGAACPRPGASPVDDATSRRSPTD